MITKKDLIMLCKSFSENRDLFSLIVNTDQKIHSSRTIKTNIKDAFKKYENSLSIREQKYYKRILGTSFNQSVKGYAFYFSDKDKIFHSFELPEGLENTIHKDNTFFIKPLVYLLDEYESYLVIVFDNQKARLMLIAKNQIENKVEFVTPGYPGSHEQGGWSQSRYARHASEHAKKHFKAIAAEAKKFEKKYKFNRVLLGTTKVKEAEIKKLLPKYILEKVQTTFPAEVFSSDHHILTQVRSLERDIERQKETEVVNELKNSLRKSRNGVAGIDDVIFKLNEKVVMQLIVEEKYDTSGYRCLECSAIGKFKQLCPYCKGNIDPVPSLINECIRIALLQKSKVELIKNNEDLIKLGSIGAICRITK